MCLLIADLSLWSLFMFGPVILATDTKLGVLKPLKGVFHQNEIMELSSTQCLDLLSIY